MIRKNPQGVSPTFELTIDDAAVNYQALNSLKLTLGENRHDLLKIGMAGVPTRAITEYRTKAVRLDINTGPGYTETFTGYVENVLPGSKTNQGLLNRSPFHDVTIVCLGASYEMRGARSKVWEGYKLSDVAQEFANKYLLSLDVPMDNLLYNQVIQSEESDWQFLVRYAKLLGYSVTCHGTHLHIFDPYDASQRGISYNKLLTLRKGSRGGRPHPGVVLEFEGRFKDDHPDGVYKDTVVTVMQEDGTQFDVSTSDLKGLSGPARFTNRVSLHAESYEEAVRIIEATNKQMYDYEAQVKTVGMLGCRPGGVVDLDGYGGEFDGMWYVEGVEHNVTSGVFTTDLNIKRNVNSELNEYRNVPALTRVPEPYFDHRNNTWRTRRDQYRVYS